MSTASTTENKNNKLVIVLLVVIAALLCAVLALFLLRGNDGGSAQSVTAGEGGTPKLGYATGGVTVVDDESALEQAVQEMKEKAAEGSMALQFKQQAYSTDGVSFSCYIGNSDRNSYDLFITIFADEELTDQLFLSGLIRPGERFENITLERALESGTHKVYVAYTQVEEDLETIHAQAFVSMDFVVS